MGKFLTLPEKKDPHLTGEARCLHCKHVWTAVAPVGTIVGLECPECHTYHGVFVGVSEPEDGTRFVCDCGCDLYYILPHTLQCLMCGVEARGF